jgi:pyruvate kinase
MAAPVTSEHIATLRASAPNCASCGHFADCKSPKIRTAVGQQQVITLIDGQPFALTTRSVPERRNRRFTQYGAVPRDCRRGDTIAGWMTAHALQWKT